ncbi:MAG: pyrroline-5-carboxylate reductase [Chloroflexota bacterium]
MNITFIGGGNMGEAMLAALLDRKVGQPGAITVSDVSDARRSYLAQKYGVNTTGDNHLAVGKGEVIVFAIKPQNLVQVMADLKGQLKSTQLLLSIVAGARISTLRQGLAHEAIVRAMPNTPAQIGEGMTVWTATAVVTGPQKKWATDILSSIGKETFVADEKFIDMATAVSGSGPAYFFYFVEALVAAAMEIGFSAEIAQELVMQTMLGSGHLVQKSNKSPAELRRMVTSPGGTTAEALAVLEKGSFTGLIQQAVVAAYDKAKKLGDERS